MFKRNVLFLFLTSIFSFNTLNALQVDRTNTYLTNTKYSPSSISAKKQTSILNSTNLELPGDEERTLYGSNYWGTSNLREWANSNQTEVTYTCNPPRTGLVNKNPYDTEKGFLTNFSNQELTMIATTNRESLLARKDTIANSNGKTNTLSYRNNNSSSINFEFPGMLSSWQNASKIALNDKIFTLTFKELTEYVQQRGWDVTKKPTKALSAKYNYDPNKNIGYNAYHPIHDIGREFIEIVSADINNISTRTNSNNAQGFAPALYLKKTAEVKVVKQYDPTHLVPTWNDVDLRLSTSLLKIGDIVEFGTYLEEPILWRIINITEEGFPLLFSEKVLDVKAFDASGDISKKYSYLDTEKVLGPADLSVSKFEYANIQGSSDVTLPKVTILNEDILSTRVNDEFLLNINITDHSGLAYLIKPDKTKVSLNGVTSYNFDIKVDSNKNYLFEMMDVKGNYRYFVIPVGNINLPPKVDITSSTTAWTNSDVSININASNDVGWENKQFSQNTRDIGGGSWGNYTTYLGKQIRVSGKVEFISNKDDFDMSKYSYGPAFTYKAIKKVNDEFMLQSTFPMVFSESLTSLKNRAETNLGPKEFDTIFTVGNNFFGNLSSRTHISLTVQKYGDVTIKYTDLKYELLDNNDFAITKIQLPNGQEIFQPNFTEKITSEGETTQTYKVFDNRGMVTEKSITSRIDKSRPNLKINDFSTKWTNSDININLSLTDTMSGLKEALTPTGSQTLNGAKSKSISETITQNGKHTFSAIDQAGNKMTQTITVSNIDKDAPVLTISDIPQTITNQVINLEISALDNLSGINKIITPTGELTNITNSKIFSFPISKNGTYTFTAIDNANNSTSKTISVDTIDTSVGAISTINVNMSPIPNDITNRNLEILFNPPESGLADIKGYSYLIDKNSLTTPDNTIDISTPKIKHLANDTGVHYLHIKTLDTLGNISNTSHHQIDIPKLTAKTNPKENMVRLDWSDMKDNTYKVFQKKEGTNEFQSISATNIDKNKQVKVLNIHPLAGEKISYTTWDGENITDSKSASLKKWMEEPNSENPKGYGQGLIEVTSIPLTDFNANPSNYLKKPDNTWAYDVLVFGTWDSNNGQDLSPIALPVVKQFVDTGRGLLLGHDTLRKGVFNSFNELRNYINVELPGDENIDNSYLDVKYAVLSEYVSKRKEGLLTKYPWNIDKTKLKVPRSHTSNQWAFGDTWFDFTSIDTTTIPTYEGIIYNGKNGNGTNNFYLTTWNNTAMIQTGHTNGIATPDEQKILANTLFYLNQLSTDNFLNDNSGQDVSAPSSITNITHTISNDGSIKFNFNEAADIGTTYSYYVEASSKNGNRVTISNIENTEIKSGLKGYSYTIDNTPNTVPNDTIDAQNSSEVTGSFKDNTSDLYLHIKSIDNIGNIGTTTHYKIPITKLSTIKLDTKINDTLFKNLEPIPLNWSVLGSNNFKTLNAKLINTTTKETYTYEILPTANTFIVPQIPKGIYNITINAIDSINRPITSNQIQIRVSTFLNNGFITSKAIETLNPVTCLKISLKQSLPKDTLILTKVYTQDCNGNIDTNNPILIDNSKLEKEFKLPYPTKKIIFEFTLSGTQENSPDIDNISISAR